jgi:hypothetical protein
MKKDNLPPIVPKADTVVICEPTEPYSDQLDPPFISILNAQTGRPEKFGSYFGVAGEAGQLAIEVPVNGAFVLQTGQRSKTGRMAWQSFSLVIEGVTEDQNSPASQKQRLLTICRDHNQKYPNEDSKK